MALKEAYNDNIKDNVITIIRPFCTNILPNSEEWHLFSFCLLTLKYIHCDKDEDNDAATAWNDCSLFLRTTV